MYKYLDSHYSGRGTRRPQPIWAAFLPAHIPSLIFMHWRESCFIRLSRASPSLELLLVLLLFLFTLSLVLFSAPSALSPAKKGLNWMLTRISFCKLSFKQVPLQLPLPKHISYRSKSKKLWQNQAGLSSHAHFVHCIRKSVRTALGWSRQGQW